MAKRKPPSRVHQARARLQDAIGDYRFATGDGYAVLERWQVVQEAIDAYARAIRDEITKGRSRG